MAALTKKKYFFETYGCQMNKAESQALQGQLNDAGWQAAAGADDAALIVLNTCSVRKTAENRVWGRLGYYRHLKTHKQFKLVVLGCMSERLSEELFSNGDIDIVIGNFQKHRLIEVVDETIAAGTRFVLSGKQEFKFKGVHSRDGFKSFVPIMHGCDNYCTYCIVPYVRGPEISRSPSSILEEIELLDNGGYKEITLLGQNVNSYRHFDGSRIMSFPVVLELIAKKADNICRLRFLTSHPKDFSDELLAVLAENPIFCRHIHLPVQHGSNKILASMGRGYSREQYMSLAEKIRATISGVAISTDILIGFPGEEEQDLDQTLELMEEVRFDDAYTYRYSPREGTKAYEMADSVAEEIKLQRLSRVIELQRRIAGQNRMARIGENVAVLVEDRSKKNGQELLGRTDGNEMVVFPGETSKIGTMTEVELLSLSGTTFHGKETK